MASLEWLPPRTHQLIVAAQQHVSAVFGERLVTVFVAGAAVSPARHDRARAPELICVAKKIAVSDLSDLGQRARREMGKGVRIRMITDGELRSSCDVFALEIADWKARHVRLVGEDILSELTVTDDHLRHSIEEQLRALGRRLRNRILSDLGTHRRHDGAVAAVGNALERLSIVVHHAVGLFGEEPPSEEAAAYEVVAGHADIDPKPVLLHVATLRQHGEVREFMAALQAILPFVDGLCAAVDALGDRQ